jgi:hypothetical protein
MNLDLNLKVSLKAMMKNKSLVLLLIFSGAAIGMSYNLMVLVQELLEPFGVDNITSGYIGFTIVIFGFFGALGSSWIIEKSP